VRETRVRSSQEFDLVLEQDPDAGEEAEEGSTVTLEVSNGPGDVRVPSVGRLPLERAIRELNKVDLKVNVDREASDDVRRGYAIRTVPREGAEVQRGTRVRLFVSSGPEQIAVPDVVGLSRASAESKLESEGLDVVVEQQQSDEPEDEVIGQEPGAGTRVDKGSRVTIVVSRGREKVDVPNVVGLSASEAARTLRAEGLGVVRRERGVDDADDDGRVVDQRPGAGSELDRGRSVTIVVGSFEEPPPQEPPAGALPQ
jgi:eukaryotic-like serine/threonine-protein kinase